MPTFLTPQEYYALNSANAKANPVSTPSNVWTPDYAAEYQRKYGRPYAPKQQIETYADGNRMVKTGALLAALGFGGTFGAGLAAGAGAAGAAGGGAGAAGGGGAIAAPAVGATTASAGAGTGGGSAATSSALSKLFNSKTAELAVNGALSVYGTKNANKYNDQARADMLAANREAIELQRQQLEMEMRNADLDREDARKLNEAINELKRRELDAAEEERAFQRSLVEQREARLAPYRANSQRAMETIAAMFAGGGQ